VLIEKISFEKIKVKFWKIIFQKIAEVLADSISKLYLGLNDNGVRIHVVGPVQPLPAN